MSKQLGGIRLSLTLFLLTPLSVGQASRNTPPDLDQLLNDIREDKYTTATIGLVAESGSPKAVPVLEVAFKKVSDPLNKEAIASALVRLGKREAIYWRALADPCQEIVRSRAPFWLVYDGDGKSVAGKISPEFLEWAKQNKLPEDAARNEQLSVLPAQIFLLAVTGDTRGRPILREGLASTNYLVRAFSSDGLALLQDYDSVPMIIKAAEQTPFELRFRVAESLVFFDDPKASAAAEKLIPQKGLLEYLRKRAKELGPRGVF
jgi:HEAT repeat protein